MLDFIFTNLIKGTETGEKISSSLVFANITFTLNNQVTTGTYEYFGRYKQKSRSRLRDSIKMIVDESFEAIQNGECFSLYKYLTQSHRRYARIHVSEEATFNECRFSGDSAFDDINNAKGHVDVISSLEDINKVWIQEVKVKDKIKKVRLDSILDFYSKYYEAINTKKPMYFYLVRPALDNRRLDGMLYFASFEVVPLEQLRDISYRLSNELTKRVFDRITKESVKSAVASIMSRNLSHNLGSHYLYYTKATLEKLADKGSHLGPDIRGAAKVLSYIQSRMDYLATIVSNDKYPYGSVNFKSQILDELTIDDFSKRHYGNDSKEEFQENFNRDFEQVELIKENVEQLKAKFAQYDKKKDDVNIRLQIADVASTLLEQVSTIDRRNIYNRTTNFLLTNLIKSEDYSRPEIIEVKQSGTERVKPLYLFVRIWNEDTKEYQLFTGSIDPSVYIRESESEGDAIERENKAKEMLSRINMALPGGTMSCHAFFNILENYIRNSAKYSWTDSKAKELTFTIAIKADASGRNAECLIYDDKHDALIQGGGKNAKSTLLNDINHRLAHMKVLAEDNTIDKDNKGLKEMVFSAVWLKANETNQSFADIITSIEGANSRKKVALIKKYAFEFMSVDDNAIPTDDPSEANLAIRIILPLFSQVESLHGKKIQDLIQLHTDIVEIPKEADQRIFRNRSFYDVFPRVFLGANPTKTEVDENSKFIKYRGSESDGINTFKLKMAIKKNLGDIDNYSLQMDAIDEPGTDFFVSPENQILFDTHFSTTISKKTLLEEYFGLKDELGKLLFEYYFGTDRELTKKKILSFDKGLDIRKSTIALLKRLGKYAYVDTISGNNFTKTLQGLFMAGLTSDFSLFRTYNDQYLSLKIKESALTRITIIDERLYNSVKWNFSLGENNTTTLDIRSTEHELMLKNVRVLNFNERSRKKGNRAYGHKVEGLPLFAGSQFMATGPLANQSNASNFLSIHLGLIEKLLKSKELEKEEYCGPRGKNPFDVKRVNRLMDLLTKTFGIKADDSLESKLHICVHSGRGNFSKELEGPLKEYPFISLAALENAFNNSKFLLSQMFYNTIFIGKGEINHKNKAS